MTPEEEREYRLLNEQAIEAVLKYEQRKAMIFIDAASQDVLETFGRDESVRILRQIAQHIEEYG